MLHSVKEILGFTVHATDGDVGHVYDLYVDDVDWTVRYFVINTGPWLLGRQVLLLPGMFDVSRWQAGEFPIDLTREQVEKSPKVDLAKPVSRQVEEELHGYYRWTPYWRSGGRALAAAKEAQAEQEGEGGDPHLRSVREVIGYHIQARDGEIGHIKDFFLGGEDWVIRYVLVNTRNWLPGRDVLIAQQCLIRVDWAESKAHVDLTRQQVRESPEYSVETPIVREYERELLRHYNVPEYWLQKPLA
jgi:hypothetical protein